MITSGKLRWSSFLAGGTFLGLAVSCLGAMESGAASSSAPGFAPVSNPYSVIANRNAFQLSAPPVPDQDKGPALDIPALYLSGFMQTGNQLKVLLAVTKKSTNQKTPDQTIYLSLSEGEHAAGVEVVKAYTDQEKVDILYSGVPITLTMKRDGFRSAGSQPNAPALPGAADNASPPPAARMGGPATRPTPPAPPATSFSTGGDANVLIGGGGMMNPGAPGLAQSLQPTSPTSPTTPGSQGSAADRGQGSRIAPGALDASGASPNAPNAPGPLADSSSSNGDAPPPLWLTLGDTSPPPDPATVRGRGRHPSTEFDGSSP